MINLKSNQSRQTISVVQGSSSLLSPFLWMQAWKELKTSKVCCLTGPDYIKSRMNYRILCNVQLSKSAKLRCIVLCQLFAAVLPPRRSCRQASEYEGAHSSKSSGQRAADNLIKMLWWRYQARSVPCTVCSCLSGTSFFLTTRSDSHSSLLPQTSSKLHPVFV